MSNLIPKYLFSSPGMHRLRLTGLAVLLLLLTGCAAELRPEQQIESYAVVSESPVWDALENKLPSTADVSWFDPQASGPYALSWRLAMIDTARVSIDAQYFLWEEDAVGSLLLERLLQAADRGVRVRLLVDDSFLPGEDRMMLAVNAHPNLEMRIFNPFQQRSGHMLLRYVENLNDYARVNHRMHNKLLIADGMVAVVGGRNIADEYFGFNKAVNFRDFDLMVTGKVVPDISSSFDNYWNSGWAFPVAEIDSVGVANINLEKLRAELHNNARALEKWLSPGDINARDWSTEWSELGPRMIPGNAVLLQDDPDIGGDNLPVQAAAQIVTQLSQAQHDVLSLSAYLVPSEKMISVAQELSSRGVRIRLLTNSLASNNHVAAHSAYRHHRRGLLEAGVDLHELRPDAEERTQFEAPGFTAEHIGLHAKILVLDKRQVFIGTLNADPRSMRLNTEVSLMVDSPRLAAVVTDLFSADFQGENSWQVKLDDKGKLSWSSSNGVVHTQPASNTWSRISDFFYGILPVDDQM